MSRFSSPPSCESRILSRPDFLYIQYVLRMYKCSCSSLQRRRADDHLLPFVFDSTPLLPGAVSRQKCLFSSEREDGLGYHPGPDFQSLLHGLAGSHHVGERGCEWPGIVTPRRRASGLKAMSSPLVEHQLSVIVGVDANEANRYFLIRDGY